MKKLLFLAVFVLLSSAVAFARVKPIYTSCGKTLYLESNDYSSLEEELEMAMKLDIAACP